MPMVSYSAADGRVRVRLDPAIPQLTPLLVSNPEDRFDPADPWFESLDPSRQGRSFSRRYGFVMNATTDPLPEGTSLWIRKMDSTPGLSVYRYSSSAPKAFEPIFGSEGSPNALRWNGMMFHPAFTAPASTNAIQAVFEAYLVDTATGIEVPNTASGPFTLEWTNVSDGRPELSIAQRIVIAWPSQTAGYILEGAEDLVGKPWTPVTNPPVLVDGLPAVVLPESESRKYFRMKRVP